MYTTTGLATDHVTGWSTTELNITRASRLPYVTGPIPKHFVFITLIAVIMRLGEIATSAGFSHDILQLMTADGETRTPNIKVPILPFFPDSSCDLACSLI